MAKSIARSAAQDTSSAVSGAIETLSAGIIHIKPVGASKELTFGAKYVPNTPTGVRVGIKLETCAKQHRALTQYKTPKKALRKLQRVKIVDLGPKP